MFGEFLWSMLGLSYMAGKGISRSASVHAYNKQYEIEEEFLSLCTNEELERGLKADLKTPALRTGVLTRIREYKAKGEGFCVTDALLWELVGVVVLTDEQILRLAMHTYGKRTAGEARMLCAVERNGNGDILTARHKEAHARAAKWKSLEGQYDIELEDRLRKQIQAMSEDRGRGSEYNAMWEQIEEYKRYGGEIPEAQKALWESVGSARLPIARWHEGFAPDKAGMYKDYMLRMALSTHGKRTVEVILGGEFGFYHMQPDEWGLQKQTALVKEYIENDLKIKQGILLLFVITLYIIVAVLIRVQLDSNVVVPVAIIGTVLLAIFPVSITVLYLKHKISEWSKSKKKIAVISVACLILVLAFIPVFLTIYEDYFYVPTNKDAISFKSQEEMKDYFIKKIGVIKIEADIHIDEGFEPRRDDDTCLYRVVFNPSKGFFYSERSNKDNAYRIKNYYVALASGDVYFYERVRYTWVESSNTRVYNLSKIHT